MSSRESMSDNNNPSNDNKKEEDSHLFTTPLWYYRLQTKRMNYFSLKLGILLLSLLVTGFVSTLLSIIYVKFKYSSDITIVLFFILWILFFYLFWRLRAKKVSLDLFENFAYHCEGISLDFDRISFDSDLPNAPIYSINSLEDFSKKIDKLYKKSNKKLKISLIDFSKKLDNLIVLLENPQENKTTLAELSKKFYELAIYAYNNHDINNESLEPVFNAIKDIVKPSRIDKFNNTISTIIAYWKKSNYIKKATLILLDIAIFFGTFRGFMQFLGVTNNYALGASMALFITLLLYIISRRA